MTARHDDLDAFIAAELDGDPAFRAAHEDAAHRRAVTEALVRARSEASLTQKTVAQRMRTTQSAVSELEGVSGDPRLSTLQRYARAVGKRVHVVLAVPSASRQSYILERPSQSFGRVDDIEWLVRHDRNYIGTARDPDVELAS